jgi:hypothetical protein
MAGADPWARLLYIAMWNWADDHGRGTANPKELAAFAFPHDDDPAAPTSAELPSLLAEVHGRWGVIFYEVNGRRYYAIPSWDTHQRNERRAQSRYPGPDEGTPYDPGPLEQRKQVQSRNGSTPSAPTHGSSAQAHGHSVPGTGEQGNRGTGEKHLRNADASRDLAESDRDLSLIEPTAVIPINRRTDEAFAQFWAAYPRKKAKQAARKAWDQSIKAADPGLIISAAKRLADSHPDLKYTPYPATWLNSGCWDDEPDRPLRAAVGGYQGWRNPPDESVYFEDFFS